MKRIIFFYASGKGFSGQQVASELLIAQMRDVGFACVAVKGPVYEQRSCLGIMRYLAAWIGYGFTVFRALRQRASLIHVNLGQSYTGFVREGMVLLLSRFFPVKKRIVSLHGNVFVAWPRRSLKGRLFAFLLKGIDGITVLGPKQVAKIAAFCSSLTEIVTMPNCCSFSALSEAEIVQKHTPGDVIKILFLGSLIDTKGYPVVLEAMEHLNIPQSFRVELNICGKFIASPFADRFRTIEEAETWTAQKIADLNKRSGNIKVTLLDRGAKGSAKWHLFKAAHFFVFPSRYPVETQPIVLIEAMACGAVIITSDQGEIPSLLGEGKSGIVLASISPEKIASTLQSCWLDWEKRQELALAGRKQFLAYHDYPVVQAKWVTLFHV